MTRRDFLHSLAITPLVGGVVAPLIVATPLPRHPFDVQQAVIASESPLILLTGARSSGKTWALQRIAEKEQRRYRRVGLLDGHLYAESTWEQLNLDPGGPLLTIVAACWNSCVGFPSADVLLVDNAENLPDNEFADLILAVRCVGQMGAPVKIIIASTLSDRDREALLNTEPLERHHFGSMLDNSYLRL